MRHYPTLHQPRLGVVVRATGTGGSKDRLTIYNATNTTLLPLGTVSLNRPDYVNAAMTFGLTGTHSTLTMTGSTLTITLGTPSGTPPSQRPQPT